jgi:hypothetical protein
VAAGPTASSQGNPDASESHLDAFISDAPVMAGASARRSRVPSVVEPLAWACIGSGTALGAADALDRFDSQTRLDCS